MKTLIFDFDGTLADSFELVIDIGHELTGIPPIDEEEMLRLRKMSIPKIIRYLKISWTHIPRFILKGRQMMQERIHEVHPFEGIPGIVQALHEAGYHLLVISSNSEENVRAFLRANHLEGYFDGVYGNASLLNKAASLRRVLRRNSINPMDCFYIGDEVRDIVAATKAGIEPVAVGWGYQDAKALKDHHPYALLDTPNELLKTFPVS